jgi:hypothetical protein
MCAPEDPLQRTCARVFSAGPRARARCQPLRAAAVLASGTTSERTRGSDARRAAPRRRAQARAQSSAPQARGANQEQASRPKRVTRVGCADRGARCRSIWILRPPLAPPSPRAERWAFLRAAPPAHRKRDLECCARPLWGSAGPAAPCTADADPRPVTRARVPAHAVARARALECSDGAWRASPRGSPRRRSEHNCTMERRLPRPRHLLCTSPQRGFFFRRRAGQGSDVCGGRGDSWRRQRQRQLHHQHHASSFMHRGSVASCR